MRAMIKMGLALAAAMVVALPVQAATFSMKRGLNLDAWMTWPNEEVWAEPSVLLPFPEWRKTVDAAKLAELKAAGFDFLRMPVDPSPFLSDQTEGFRDDLYASVLDSVRLVNAAGLKVVVDLHLMPAGGNRRIGMGQVMDDPALFDAYLGVVREMGRTLAKEDPRQVALELMNEPVIKCDAESAPEWQNRLAQLFAAARASALDTTLVLSGGCWATSEGLAAIDPKTIPDDNVIWTFHSYAPFLLTHQGATWAGDFIPHVTGIPYPPYAVPRAELDAAVEKVRKNIRADAPWTRRSGMLAYLDELIAGIDTKEKLDVEMGKPFDEAASWADKNGIARENVFLGEFGMIRQEYGKEFVMPAAWRAAYVKDMAELAEKHGFPWAVWSYGGAFGVIEEFSGRPAEGDVVEVVRRLQE